MGTKNGRPQPRHGSSERNSRGMTLIELVVAMVIVALLASIAIPSYRSYILKSHRTEAKTALLDLASMEERYFSTQNVYSATTTDLGYAGPWPVIVGSGYYQLQTPFVNPPTAPTALNPAGTPATFTLTAVPVPGNMQTQDTTCISFTVDSTGARTALPVANSVQCWQ